LVSKNVGAQEKRWTVPNDSAAPSPGRRKKVFWSPRVPPKRKADLRGCST